MHTDPKSTSFFVAYPIRNFSASNGVIRTFGLLQQNNFVDIVFFASTRTHARAHSALVLSLFFVCRASCLFSEGRSNLQERE